MNTRISPSHVLIGWMVVVAFPALLLAGPGITIDRSAVVEFFETQCTIMEVHPGEHSLIVGENRIELVDFQEGDTRYRTILKDSQGHRIPFRSFKKGQWVFVRGFRLSQGTIAAREIYQLPGMVSRPDLYPFFQEVPAWGEPLE
jgi:hypothetical protein